MVQQSQQSQQSQQGNATIVMVLLAFAMAGMMLHESSQLLSQQSWQVDDEKAYLQAYYQAESALQWGLTLVWTRKPGWQCQALETHQTASCLFTLSQNHGILRGNSINQRLSHWRRVIISADGQHLTPTPHGWSDRCPWQGDACEPTGI